MVILARGVMGSASMFVAAVLHTYIGEMSTTMDEIRKKKGKGPMKQVLYIVVMFTTNGVNTSLLGNIYFTCGSYKR